VLPGVLSAVGSVAAVFFSHPDESHMIAKIIAMAGNRYVVFTDLTRIEQIRVGNQIVSDSSAILNVREFVASVLRH
jgi:hypothetical protein